MVFHFILTYEPWRVTAWGSGVMEWAEWSTGVMEWWSGGEKSEIRKTKSETALNVLLSFTVLGSRLSILRFRISDFMLDT
jgi:hypothetical protein